VSARLKKLCLNCKATLIEPLLWRPLRAKVKSRFLKLFKFQLLPCGATQKQGFKFKQKIDIIV
jgi:hypothetical protein